jgi:nitrogen fixation/metabolism regulation signal transduction histidine kinase
LESAESLINNKVLTTSIFNQSISKKDLEKVQVYPFYFFIFKNDSVVFWNNTVVNPFKYKKTQSNYSFVKDKYGYFLYKTHLFNDSQLIQIQIPIKFNNEQAKDLVNNNFVALGVDERNEYNIETNINSKNLHDSVIINNKCIFYLVKKPLDQIVKNTNFIDLFKSLIFIILFGVSIHTYFKIIIKTKPILLVFCSLLFSVFIFRGLHIFLKFPNDYSHYSLFDPSIFHYDFINNSLGDLLINVCLVFWILEFYYLNVQDDFRIKIPKYIIPFMPIACSILLFSLFIYYTIIVRSIIIDSSLSFDSSLIENMSINNMVAIAAILVMCLSFVIHILITKRSFEKYYTNYYFKYVVLVFFIFCFYFFKGPNSQLNYFVISSWIIVCFIFLDKQTKVVKFDFSSYRLLIWLIFVAFSCSLFITSLVFEKDKINQIELAKSLSESRDYLTEKKLLAFENSIINDKNAKKFFKLKDVNARSLLYDYVSSQYYNIFNIDIEAAFSMYGKEIKSSVLYDTTNLRLLNDIYNNAYIKISNNTKVNLRKDNPIFYVSKLIIKDKEKVIGELFIKIYRQKIFWNSSYRNLLKLTKKDNKRSNLNYSYSIYESGNQTNQQGTFEFNRTLDSNSWNQYQKNKSIIHISNKTIDVFIHDNSSPYLIFFTLFALLFIIIFIAITLYIIGNIIVRSNLNYLRFLKLLNVNLRFRIHGTIIIIEIISFVAIWFIVSNFFIDRLKENKKVSLVSKSQETINKISTIFKMYSEGQEFDTSNKELIIKNNEINYELRNSAEAINAQINIISKKGQLLFTSQTDFYEAGLMSNYISPNYFFQKELVSKNQYFTEARIGELNYFLINKPLSNEINNELGYIQVAYFDDLEDTKKEESKMLITLINIFIAVFAFASVFAFFITNYITKSFSKVVKQFTKINLSTTNEPLKWPYSDEIGVLVMEYNRMLRKLENSMMELAKNERDSAWREMAQQVAHEIKNPLTPMKLSLQMLQRSISKKDENIIERTSKMTETMIEQIDVLTVIASNFSSFAKLPEMKLAHIDICELLQVSLSLYENKDRVEMSYEIPSYPIFVDIDKVQMQRVFTNLLENAIQSIDQNIIGNLNVSIHHIRPEHKVLISIEDNGMGVPLEIRDKIFNPNFTTKSSGSGLGLAMCKDIIEQFKGKIWFSSEIHKGTVFYIELPILKLDDELHYSIS